MEGLIFYDTKPNDGADYVRIFGLVDKKRVYRWIKRDYIDVPSNFDKYKVLVPESNGRGSMEDVFSTPLVVEPFVGHTQTFISIGGYNDKLEAEALLKYIKTKFARALLSIMKATQHNPVSVWTHIPLQNFSSRSDVNWQQNIASIDFQLYEKYGLSQTEIDFIESHVKEMA